MGDLAALDIQVNPAPSGATVQASGRQLLVINSSEVTQQSQVVAASTSHKTHDCWHPQHDAVTVEEIVSVLHQNAAHAAAVVRSTVQLLDGRRDCKCGSALAHALITDRAAVPAATLQKLAPLVAKYFPTSQENA